MLVRAPSILDRVELTIFLIGTPYSRSVVSLDDILA